MRKERGSVVFSVFFGFNENKSRKYYDWVSAGVCGFVYRGLIDAFFAADLPAGRQGRRDAKTQRLLYGNSWNTKKICEISAICGEFKLKSFSTPYSKKQTCYQTYPVLFHDPCLLCRKVSAWTTRSGSVFESPASPALRQSADHSPVVQASQSLPRWRG